MTARFSSNQHSFNRCDSAAAACASAFVIDILDTVMILAVSIIVLSLRLLV